MSVCLCVCLCVRVCVPGCGATLTTPTGTITSPGHPSGYPHGAECMWFISVAPGNLIRLTFDSFNLEYNLNCIYDYVEVYDNGTVQTGAKVGRYGLSGSSPLHCGGSSSILMEVNLPSNRVTSLCSLTDPPPPQRHDWSKQFYSERKYHSPRFELWINNVMSDL